MDAFVIGIVVDEIVIAAKVYVIITFDLNQFV